MVEYLQQFARTEKIINKTDEYLQTAYALPKKKPGWATSNDIILEEKTLHLRRFLNPNICARRPVLILPPQAGHHGNIADYSPEQSLVRVFHSMGYDVYVTDWQSASPEYKDLGLEDYINLTDRAVEENQKADRDL
jgi:poly(3-hydroxyalkanoate) synthetase